MLKSFLILIYFSIFSLSTASNHADSPFYFDAPPSPKDILKLLPKNGVISVIQELNPIYNLDVSGYPCVLVHFTVQESSENAPKAEFLAILKKNGPKFRFKDFIRFKRGYELGYTILVESCANELNADSYFFDSDSGKIAFAVRYDKLTGDVSNKSTSVEEIEINYADGSIQKTLIVESGVEKLNIIDTTADKGKVTSYNTIEKQQECVYLKNQAGKFEKIAQTTSIVNPLHIMVASVKHTYLRYDTADSTTLKWYNPETYELEETNFQGECSLFDLDSTDKETDIVFIIDPNDPKNILGRLVWEKGIIRPELIDPNLKQLFKDAEIAIREKLSEENPNLENAEFDYKSFYSPYNNAIFGDFKIFGFNTSLLYSFSRNDRLKIYTTTPGVKTSSTSGSPSILRPFKSCLPSIDIFHEQTAYQPQYEFVEMVSEINGSKTTVRYSLFKPVEGQNLENSKALKTLVYIQGGPWVPFMKGAFLESHKPFIEEGYTIIVPHEPTRDGFGSEYLTKPDQIGRNNLYHIMNILDHAHKNKAINPNIVLKGASYGGWVACALAACWIGFRPEGSQIQLHACIAEAADLDLIKWKDATLARSLVGARTFSETPLNVASITQLQARLLICHGLGDVRCPIESVNSWHKILKENNQPITFITTPIAHSSIFDLFPESPKGNTLARHILEKVSRKDSQKIKLKDLKEHGVTLVHDGLKMFR